MEKAKTGANMLSAAQTQEETGPAPMNLQSKQETEGGGQKD